jgi:lipopolysaccharide assembly outer membrane protein LptD (OstA)
LLAIADSSIAPLPAPAVSGGSTAPQPPEHVVFQASQQGHWDEQKHTLTIDGPVIVREGKVEMQTVGAVYDHSTDVAVALAPVTIVDDKNTLTGEHGTINFQTHVATIDGTVEMSATPTSAGNANKSSDTLDSQTRKPTRMYCDHIVYNYRTKIADASGHLKIVQTDRTVTADAGKYDTGAQMIALVGNVDGRDTDGKHLTAPSADVSVDPKNEYIDVKGPIVYDFPVNETDNPLPATARSSTSAPAPDSDAPTTTAPQPPKSP